MKHREVFFLFGLTKIVHPSSDVLFPTPLLHLPHFICSSKKGKEKKKGEKVQCRKMKAFQGEVLKAGVISYQFHYR